jgi:hypothetical protein
MSKSPAAILFDVSGNLAVIQSGFPATGSVTGSAPGVMVAGSDGSFARLMRMASDGTVRVDPTGTTAQTITGSVSVTGSISVTNSITVTGSVKVMGNVPHGTAVTASNPSPNPLIAGSVVAPVMTGSNAAASGTVMNNISDLYGRVLISHIDPSQQSWRTGSFSSAQTGAVLWTSATNKRIAVTSVVISTGGTTAGQLILWFGAVGDTTYNANVDQAVLIANFAPTSNSKPGLVFTPSVPVFCNNVNYLLRVTCATGMTTDMIIYGYEW